MGVQIPGWSGIQSALVNQFPRRPGVQLNDGAISQATREGVLPGTGGIQQTRGGKSCMLELKNEFIELKKKLEK